MADPSELFELCSNERVLSAVEVLSESGETDGLTRSELAGLVFERQAEKGEEPKSQDSVRVSLRQRHLPRMVDCGLVEVTRENGHDVIRPTGSCHDVASAVEAFYQSVASADG